MAVYADQIERAFSAAQIIEISDTPPTGVAIVDVARRDRLIETADDFPVFWNCLPEHKTVPDDIILVPDVVELGVLSHEVVEAARGDHTRIDNDLAHEEHHAYVARELGASSILYGMRLFRMRQGVNERMGYQPLVRCLDLETTRIGIAALVAHPEVPSTDDITELQSLGYTGNLYEIKERIARYNDTHEDQLPIPLSFAG